MNKTLLFCLGLATLMATNALFTAAEPVTDNTQTTKWLDQQPEHVITNMIGQMDDASLGRFAKTSRRYRRLAQEELQKRKIEWMAQLANCMRVICNNLRALNYDELKQEILRRLNLAAAKNVDESIDLDLSQNNLGILAGEQLIDLCNTIGTLLGNRLVALDLSDNSLRELPAAMLTHFPNLRTLFLSNNIIKTIPGNIFINNKKLEDIDLSANRISTLPENILAGLHSLKTINIRQNKLRTLPANIFQDNPRLNYIDLAENKLQTLPVQIFANLKPKAIIDLRGNKRLDSVATQIKKSNPNLEIKYWNIY